MTEPILDPDAILPQSPWRVPGNNTVDGKPYRFFYNPMWSRLGDGSAGPCGTYFYNRSESLNYFWHTFDQILLRPDLLSTFDLSGLRVVTQIGERELLKSQRTDDALSDHLPIVIRLDIESRRPA
jgi:hypothetical protein